MSHKNENSGPFAFQVTGRTEYITPKWVIDALWPIDLDPCSAKVQPWPTAKKMYTERGLEQPWKGLVYVNPPYGKKTETPFIKKLIEHGNGIALLSVKTETELWQELVFKHASAILYLGRGRHLGMVSNRISFANCDGSPTGGSFAAHALVAFGQVAVSRLRKSKLPGYLVTSFERM